jgi:hypothetical protein
MDLCKIRYETTDIVFQDKSVGTIKFNLSFHSTPVFTKYILRND